MQTRAEELAEMLSTINTSTMAPALMFSFRYREGFRTFIGGGRVSDSEHSYLMGEALRHRAGVA